MATADTAAVRISVINRPSIVASGSPVSERYSWIIAMCVCFFSSALAGKKVTILAPITVP